MSDVIRMTEAQAKRVYKLARKTCCNCYDGFCVLLDTPCPQCITRSLICKWFIRAVLPADVPLYVELTGDRGKAKPCTSEALRQAVSFTRRPGLRRHVFPRVPQRLLSA